MQYNHHELSGYHPYGHRMGGYKELSEAVKRYRFPYGDQKQLSVYDTDTGAVDTVSHVFCGIDGFQTGEGEGLLESLPVCTGADFGRYLRYFVSTDVFRVSYRSDECDHDGSRTWHF